MGLIGQPSLYTFDNPYNVPGVHPAAHKQLYVLSVKFAFIFLKVLLSASFNEMIYFKQSPLTNVNLDLSFKIHSFYQHNHFLLRSLLRFLCLS